MKKRINKKKAITIFSVIMVLIFVIVFFIITYAIERELLTGLFKSYGLVVFGILGFLVGVGIFYIPYRMIIMYKKRKNGNIPLMDERSYKLIRNYFLVVLYLILVISSVVVLILIGMGIKEISVINLVFYLMATYILIGLGFIIVALKN